MSAFIRLKKKNPKKNKAFCRLSAPLWEWSWFIQMLRITPLIWALLDLIPIRPHGGHLQPFRQFALMPLTEYCLHVLHEVSVHRFSPRKEQQTWVSKRFHSVIAVLDWILISGSIICWVEGRGLKLQICVFTGSSFNLNTFFPVFHVWACCSTQSANP